MPSHPNTQITNNKQYRVILADPPWSYFHNGSGAARHHYKTMTQQEICALPVSNVAHQNCVLIMWATWPQLTVAIGVGQAWGFRHVTGFPWIKLYHPPAIDQLGQLTAKPVFGIGYWVRGCSEPILIFARGKAKPPVCSWLGLLSKRLEHSRKPDDIYAYAESLEGPYLELFARRQRPGWDVFGNEVKKSINLIDIPVHPVNRSNALTKISKFVTQPKPHHQQDQQR